MRLAEQTIYTVTISVDEDGHKHLLINGEPTMGASEVADAIGVRVQNLQYQKGLPGPVEYLRATRLWLGCEVLAFASARKNHSPR